MITEIERRLEALFPDTSVRERTLSIFAESIRFIRARKPDWCHVRLARRRLRLFAGRLIVLTLHPEGVWVTTDASGRSEDPSGLHSWRWDTEKYARYQRVPSRNGYYSPILDHGADWPLIQAAHFAYLEQALARGVVPDHRTAAKHDAALLEYIEGRTVIEAYDTQPTALSSSRDTTPSFTHAEVFPLIAGLILRATKQSDAFVTHAALVSMVLDDSRGAELVVRARAKASWSSDKDAASNMVAWFSQQISVGRSEWADFFVRERVEGAWAYRPAAVATPGKIPDADFSAMEGEPRIFLHLRRERDTSLVAAKRASARNSSGQLECEVCGFVAELAYPGLSAGLCEVHHRRPLSELAGSTETRLDDLAVLCPNCHRAIHQTRPMMTVEEFRQRMRQRGAARGGTV